MENLQRRAAIDLRVPKRAGRRPQQDIGDEVSSPDPRKSIACTSSTKASQWHQLLLTEKRGKWRQFSDFLENTELGDSEEVICS
jgi:hypothetical protein